MSFKGSLVPDAVYEHCLALARGGGLEHSGIPKLVFREAGAQLTRKALHKAELSGSLEQLLLLSKMQQPAVR